MRPETPDRDLQREMVYQQVKDPISRELLRASIPTSATVYHLSEIKGQENTRKLTELIRRESGSAFKQIFAIATVAQNPDQLSNAFNALSGIQHWASIYDNRENKIVDKAYDEFLRDSVVTPFASDGARSLQAEFVSYLNRANGNTRHAISFIKNKYAANIGNTLDSPYWAEAYLLTILDPNTPLELRKELLRNSLNFHAGYPWRFGGSPDPRFEKKASIWKNASAEWIYPNLFGADTNRDAKDWEIAGLRKTLADLQK